MLRAAIISIAVLMALDAAAWRGHYLSRMMQSVKTSAYEVGKLDWSWDE